jgi:hypothetical protein
VDFFLRMINKFIDKMNKSETPSLFDFDETDPMSTDNVIVCVHTEDEINYTMAVFNIEQWSMIEDISELTSQSIEEVVRSLDTNSPNIIVFNKDDFIF